MRPQARRLSWRSPRRRALCTARLRDRCLLDDPRRRRAVRAGDRWPAGRLDSIVRRITCEPPADEGLAWLLGFDGSQPDRRQRDRRRRRHRDGEHSRRAGRLASAAGPDSRIELPHVGRPAGRSGRVAALARGAEGCEPSVPVPLARARRERLGLRTRGVPARHGKYKISFALDASQQGEVREFQIAHLRHALDREAPGHLIWSPLDTVTIASPPLELTAEATHDSVRLSWGPDAPGLTYTATISVGDLRYASAKDVRMSSDETPPYTAHFGNLLPDTRYSVSVHLNSGYGATVRSFELRTEPAPEGASADDWKPREPRRCVCRRTAASHVERPCAGR